MPIEQEHLIYDLEHGSSNPVIRPYLQTSEKSSKVSKMQCDICHRSVSTRLPFNCTICARDALYQSRIQHAQTLLQSESLGQEVERSTAGLPKPAKLSPHSANPKAEANLAWATQRAVADQTESADKARLIYNHIGALREETQKIKTDIAARKAKLLKRRAEFESAKRELSQSQATAVEPVEKGIRRTEHRWDIMHEKTAESRSFLCREAALLYGLQQRKRKKGGLGRDVYFIGGVPIADLRDLNSTPSFHFSLYGS